MRQHESNALIEVSGLSKTYRVPIRQGLVKRLLKPAYRDVNAVRDLDFSIRSGEQVALLGPNGSGKSTTLKMLCGLLAPTSGTVLINGLDPIQKHNDMSRSLSAFFGNKTSLWPRLPVDDSFEYVRIIYGLDKETFKRRKAELVDIFELTGLLDRLPHSLSLGEKMRCELVRRLLPDPQILLLDEPTIGMDVVSKNKFRDLIREYASRNGITLLLTSHDTRDIESLCQRVIVIRGGRKIFDGDFSTLRQEKPDLDHLESILVDMFTGETGT